MVSYFSSNGNGDGSPRRYYCYLVVAGPGPTAGSGVATITTLAVHGGDTPCGYCPNFFFARSGGPQEVLNRSSQLLKSGWNLLVFPEGTRSDTGVLQEFKPGIGHLATENRVDVIPMHVRGAHRIMPKGRNLPLPAAATVRIGKPLKVGEGETSRSFAERVEKAVHQLADGTESKEVAGSWIDRWQATEPRRTRR